MTSYVPNTESERLEMLAAIGKKEISDLFSAIPQEVMMKEPFKIPEGESGEKRLLPHNLPRGGRLPSFYPCGGA